MKRNYATELATLPDTYVAGSQVVDLEPIRAVLSYGGPLVFAGSGGALAVAQLAADLHTARTGELALAATPLSLATASHNPDVGLVLFSARGRHPDGALVVNAARMRGATHLGLVTTRNRVDLPESLAAGDVRIATVPAAPDGFLATNSLMAMAIAVCRAHETELPASLPSFDAPWGPPVRESCLVLTGVGTESIALDLEARLTETGLAGVQMADYRNAAHGRHVGLIRNKHRTTVVAVSDPRSRALAERTLGLLPADINIRRLDSGLDWPASVLDLLVQSMGLVASTGDAHGVDPGQPGVASFGRRLYHLPVRRLAALAQPDPVLRKLGHDRGASTRRITEAALERWMDHLTQTPIGGLVLDYDGTVCPTWDRFEPPPVAVRAELLRLLEGGLILGFATGRGRSLHEMTRSWMPQVHWPRVEVGLYNGSQMLTLADPPGSAADCVGDLHDAADRLEHLGLQLVVERRSAQLSVTASGAGDPSQRLRALVQSVVDRPPLLACSVVASGHSVDVILVDAGKASVLEAVRRSTSLEVLAIGDQGQVGGNDYELLSATELSLSVDRCSPDPSRCWNLDVRGERGPDLLARYLRALQKRKAGFRFAWPLR